MTQSTTNLLYEVPIKKMDDSITNLTDYTGQVLLIVNVASHCGFTSQYAQLEAMHNDYQARGFSVLGFPCNQFFRQEPGSNEEIQTFAKNRYQVTFPLFAKINVKGKDQAPLYHYLAQHLEKKPLKFIPWNFTKILIDPQGNALKQYLPVTSLNKIRRDVEKLLPKT